jgi:outer membrane protein assembly factor BamB
MTIHQTNEPTDRKPLRLWPGVAAVVAQWLLWYVLPIVAPDAGLVGMFGGALCAPALLVWWLFFSRARWSERVGAILFMIVAMLATKRIVHESIAGAGMGMLLYIATIPGLCLALVGWAVATRRLPDGVRPVSLAAAILLACAPWTLLRTGGIIAGGGSDYHWRWTATPEQRLLAQADDEPGTPPTTPSPAESPDKPPAGQASSEPAAAPARAQNSEKRAPAPAAEESGPPAADRTAARTEPEWPGFRGPGRDGIVHGVTITTDWSQSPPVQLWRRPIGPGWSSFAVQADRLYTQEQRGEDEIVAAYKVSNGEPVWRHRDRVRFWESNGGAGPRATPTLSGRRVYAFGATGILNALDARSGAVLWTRNVASDTGRRVPDWGFASSPLVVADVVIVAASGTLAAYDVSTGKPRWFGPQHGGSYSSPHPLTIDGVTQILLLNGAGATSVAPADGKVLWEYSWPGNTTIVQPAQMTDRDLLISTTAATGGNGIRRLAIEHGSGGWSVEERWSSTGLKPYFNDYVIHKGHAFGFDGSILACIDLEDGRRTWKGGRYGNGQLVLLSEQDVLLVVSEDGELALVKASPDGFTELARFPALEGKTWNHPVLVGDRLLIRNGEEMAAFRLPLARR